MLEGVCFSSGVVGVVCVPFGKVLGDMSEITDDEVVAVDHTGDAAAGSLDEGAGGDPSGAEALVRGVGGGQLGSTREFVSGGIGGFDIGIAGEGAGHGVGRERREGVDEGGKVVWDGRSRSGVFGFSFFRIRDSLVRQFIRLGWRIYITSCGCGGGGVRVEDRAHGWGPEGQRPRLVKDDGVDFRGVFQNTTAT